MLITKLQSHTALSSHLTADIDPSSAQAVQVSCSHSLWKAHHPFVSFIVATLVSSGDELQRCQTHCRGTYSPESHSEINPKGIAELSETTVHYDAAPDDR
jgi:hypothetical protein